MLLYNGMIRLLTAGVRTGLVAAVMAAAVPMITFAQTTEIESAPAAVEAAVAKSAPPAVVEVETQRETLNQFAEYITWWAETVTWWLTGTAIFLTLFAVAVALAGLFSFKRFQEIKDEAKKSADEAKKSADSAVKDAKDAKRCLEEIKTKQDEANEIVRNMDSKAAAKEPGEAKQAAENVQNNPEASPIDQAIARAILLQQHDRTDDAVEKWRAIAQVAEKSDNDLAARAWFSVGYLVRNKSPVDCISANDKAIRLNPDYAEAYYNRGNAKNALGRHDDAIADYDEAIRLNPDDAEAYNNRGNVKNALGRHDDAIADYDEAIRLNPDYALAYNNRGVAKADLKRYDDAIADYDEAIRLKPDDAIAYKNRGEAKADLKRYDDAIVDYDEAIRLKPDDAIAYKNRGRVKAALGDTEEARKDFETALERARNAGNADMVSRAEQSLRDLDADNGR